MRVSGLFHVLIEAACNGQRFDGYGRPLRQNVETLVSLLIYKGFSFSGSEYSPHVLTTCPLLKVQTLSEADVNRSFQTAQTLRLSNQRQRAPTHDRQTPC